MSSTVTIYGLAGLVGVIEGYLWWVTLHYVSRKLNDYHIIRRRLNIIRGRK